MKFRVVELIRAYWQTWIVVLGPLLLSPILFLSTDTQQEKEAYRCGYLILLMILYWLTEALPLPVTAMIPMVGFPVLGLMSTKDVAVNYLNATNYMFFGGLIMAIAVEHCGLHLRVALRIIKMVGTSQARLMLGFMLTTMFISMWISNTATTAMMIPIVNAVVKAINSKEEDGDDGDDGEDNIDIITDEETKPMISTESFESELKQLTNGKINNIDQLKSLVKLDEGCGHFEDLETITKKEPAITDSDKVMKTENNGNGFLRSGKMKRLRNQQSVIKEIRQNEKLAEVTRTSQRESEREDGETEEDDNDESEVQRNYLLLGLAMSSNIGGTGVVTGTPPNLVAPDVLRKYGEGTSGLTFASWMAFAIPVMLVNLLLAWLWLQQLMAWTLGKRSSHDKKDKEAKAMRAIIKKYEELGKMTVHEIQVAILFIILILLWFFKTPIFIPGWSDLFDATNSNGDKVAIAQATPAILIVLLLFILPKTYNFCSDSKGPIKKAPALITWRLIETKMCWGVLFLLGGGFTLAKCLQTSGLSLMLVKQLKELNLSTFPGWVASLIFTGIAVIITNVCSNTATANVFVPILADLAITMCLNPVFLTLPAAIACSYAFSLPVSTAPNAIVYGNSTMKTVDMFKAGVVMNLICYLVLNLAINTYAVPMFGLDTFPAWAATDAAIKGRCLANSTL